MILVQYQTGKWHNFLKSTVSRTPDFMLFLWKTHIRPIIDYCSVIWNTGYLEDLHLLEGVQRRWTKSITGMDNLSYGERLSRLKLFSVQGRLLRSDLIQYWKILNNKSCITPDILFTLQPHPATRGHQLKILTPRASTDTRQHFFYTQMCTYVELSDCRSCLCAWSALSWLELRPGTSEGFQHPSMPSLHLTRHSSEEPGEWTRWVNTFINAFCANLSLHQNFQWMFSANGCCHVVSCS